MFVYACFFLQIGSACFSVPVALSSQALVTVIWHFIRGCRSTWEVRIGICPYAPSATAAIIIYEHGQVCDMISGYNDLRSNES
jgi:hypothetical protein